MRTLNKNGYHWNFNKEKIGKYTHELLKKRISLEKGRDILEKKQKSLTESMNVELKEDWKKEENPRDLSLNILN